MTTTCWAVLSKPEQIFEGWVPIHSLLNRLIGGDDGLPGSPHSQSIFDEPLRCSLAFCCLTGAHSGLLPPVERLVLPFEADFTKPLHRMGILETAESAAYSSQCRKKNHPPKSEALSDQNAITRSDTARDGVCCYFFNLRLGWGYLAVPPNPHPQRKTRLTPRLRERVSYAL